MELQYYYSVLSIYDTYTSEKILVGLFWGRNLKELALDILNFFEPTLRSSTQGFNIAYNNHLDYDNVDFYTQCVQHGFQIAPIIAIKDKLNSGKELTINDFKSIDFFQFYDGSQHVVFSQIPESIRDLRDICASTADEFGFYDDLPSDFEFEISEEKIITPFFDLTKKWNAAHYSK